MREQEFNDDSHALAYIEAKGYASYSSMKLVRDCEVPRKFTAAWFDEGTATHSLLLQHKLDVVLTPEQKWKVKKMLQSLCNNSVVRHLLADSVNEDRFPILVKKKGKEVSGPPVVVNRLPVLGYIDINARRAIGDLKTTRHTKKAAFIADMDFLQAALYRHVTSKRDFIYIGVCKTTFEVFTFNVNEYPKRIEAAMDELDYLTKYIAKKLPTICI